MSTRDWEVEDEEGSVDSSQKRRLLELRRQIDDREDAVLSEQRVGNIDPDTAADLIGDAVRRYLRALEPLMRQTEGGESITSDGAEPVLAGAQETFLDVQLGEVTVPVPERIASIPENPGSARGSASRWLSGSPPQDKSKPVRGLLSVITDEQVTAEWTVEIRHANPDAGQAHVDKRVVSASAPMPRGVLQNAVRTADMWIQQVGLGINIEQDGLPMATNFDQSGEGSTSELSSGHSDNAPDL